MAAVTYNDEEWDVDGGGVPTRKKPSLNPVAVQVTRAEMDDVIAGIAASEANCNAAITKATTQRDAFTQFKNDMQALRDTATSDPA